MKRWREIDRGAAAALLAGLALRGLFVRLHPRFAGDALVYGDLAHNMLQHHVFGFSEETVRSTLIRLPGYPLVLAACFLVFGDANYLAVIWVQVVLDLLSCWLLAGLAERLVGSQDQAAGRRVGKATLWLGCLCPFTANYTAAALTETCVLLSVVLAFVAMGHWLAAYRAAKQGTGWALATGGALAFSVMLRPDQGLLAAAVIPVMLWVGWRSGERSGRWRLRLLPGALAAVVMVLPLLLWGVRNWKVFHVVQPLAPRYANDPGEGVPFGFQRWYRTWAIDFKSTFDVYWNYDGNPLKLEDLPARAIDNAQQLAQTRAVYAAYNQETASTPAFDAAFAQIAEERVQAHPLRYYVEMPLARELNMWLRPRTELLRLPIDWWAVRLHPRRSVAEIGYAALDAAYLMLGVAGVWIFWRRGCEGQGALATAMLAFVALRCALLLTLDNSEPRYTLECFPVVILMAGIAVGLRQRRVSG